MKRYCKNSKPYIYVAFPVDKKEEVLNILEILNKDDIEFWYPDNFNKKEIKRINASFNVLAFVTNDYAKSEQFRNIIDNAVNFNRNILCVYLEDVEESSWMKMQLASQQSLRTEKIDDEFIKKLKTSFIFKDMKVTPVQKKLQRNKAIIFISVPVVLALALFFSVVKPLMADKQEKEEIVEHWGLTGEDLEQITGLYIVGDHSYSDEVHAEYTNDKNVVDFWWDIEHNNGLKYISTTSVGSLTSKDLEIVKYMPNLRHLYICGEQISDISPLFGTKITQLDLSCNPITSLEGIEQIPELRILKLSDTDISDIEPIRGLKYLEYLQINKTNVSNIDAVEDLTYLNWLDITNTKVTKITKMPKTKESNHVTLVANMTKLNDVSGLGNVPYYRGINIDNVYGYSFDKQFGEALENSVVELLNYSGCSSLEAISGINIADYGYINFNNPVFINLDGLGNLKAAKFVDISRNINVPNTIVGLKGALDLETLTTLTLSPDLEELANVQLKDAKFHIEYKWREEGDPHGNK